MITRRKDNKGRVLKEEETQRKDGTYDYRWRTVGGKRCSIYARTLDELRMKEEKIKKDTIDGIRTDNRQITVNELYELWKSLKKGVKENTMQNYCYMYELFVSDDLGKKRITNIKKSDIKRFYNHLVEHRGLKVRSLESIHTVLFQVMELAVEEGYLRNNPSHNAMKELKLAFNFETPRRRALTVPEQQLFVKELLTNRMFNKWKNIFIVMLYSGLRVGELTGLTWSDINFDLGYIDVNHTLVYYKHAENGCYYSVNTPKTKKGNRIIPMLPIVKEALTEEKKLQLMMDVENNMVIDGYTNFIFLNRYGKVYNQGVLNKALRYIMRETNEKILNECTDGSTPVLLPRFSCHCLRHTFATRMCEANLNIKVIQEILGHADVRTSMNLYVSALPQFKEAEVGKLNDFFQQGSMLQITPTSRPIYAQIEESVVEFQRDITEIINEKD